MRLVVLLVYDGTDPRNSVTSSLIVSMKLPSC